MSINALNAPLSGLNAAQYRQNVTANNVANVNTPDFQPAQTRTADAAYVNDVGQGATASAVPAGYAPPRPGQIQQPGQPGQATMAQTANPVTAPSNVDMITETTNRMQAQNAYGANMPAARAMNEMSQTLMDIQS